MLYLHSERKLLETAGGEKCCCSQFLFASDSTVIWLAFVRTGCWTKRATDLIEQGSSYVLKLHFFV